MLEALGAEWWTMWLRLGRAYLTEEQLGRDESRPENLVTRVE